jgi:hypothetical protein
MKKRHPKKQKYRYLLTITDIYFNPLKILYGNGKVRHVKEIKYKKCSKTKELFIPKLLGDLLFKRRKNEGLRKI